MSRQTMLYLVSPSRLQQLLIPALFTFIVIFSSCKPAAAPSTSSPLQTPASSLLITPPASQTPLAADMAHKLTPSVSIITTQLPPYFRTEPFSTPVGSGAIGHMLPLFFVHQINVTNVWFEDTAGGTMRTYVFAGSKPGLGGESTQQGLVLVQVAKMSPQGAISVVYEKEFSTPTQSGPISITSAIAERLILQSANGTSFYFDAPLRQFVPSLAWTPTPGPISPIATPTSAP